jgi:murein DD-endopeptidase MepM/ murein hydrolase activator NlpD
MYRYLIPLLIFGGVAGFGLRGGEAPPASALIRLPPQLAVGIRVDTLLVGGYAAGTFAAAIQSVANDLRPHERDMVGRHLDRIFSEVLAAQGLGRGGRLRVAYERALRPDGVTRSIRVLGAEVATGGRLHSAFYFEKDGVPGYFDPFGRSMDRSAWIHPLHTVRVSSPFGEHRLHPILQQILPHTGIDLAAPMGEPVHAAADGVVARAEIGGGYGLLVELQHPSGFSTRYAHLSGLEPGIVAARLVRQGERIGYVGATGLATGPHLHFEVRRRGQPIDPLRLSRDPSLAPDIGATPGWPDERRRIGALLARTPTVVRTVHSGEQ